MEILTKAVLNADLHRCELAICSNDSCDRLAGKSDGKEWEFYCKECKKIVCDEHQFDLIETGYENISGHGEHVCAECSGYQTCLMCYETSEDVSEATFLDKCELCKIERTRIPYCSDECLDMYVSTYYGIYECEDCGNDFCLCKYGINDLDMDRTCESGCRCYQCRENFKKCDKCLVKK